MVWSAPRCLSVPARPSYEEGELYDYVHSYLLVVRWADTTIRADRPSRAPPIFFRSRARAIIDVMGLVGLHHVSINVDDVDTALAFYVEVLGLKVRPDRPDFSFGGAWLDAGGQQIHLIEADAPICL